MFSQLEELFSKALGVTNPWKIQSIRFDSENQKLDIYIDFEKGATFDYPDYLSGETSKYKAYDKIDKTWRHLNFFEHTCYLHVKVPRIKPETGGVKMIFPKWTGAVYGFTLLFEALIIQMSKNMPVHNVAKILRISDHKIWSVLDSYIEKALAFSDNSNLTAIGMDETSLKRGHNYISLFVDMHEKKTIFITEGKDSNTVASFAEKMRETDCIVNNIKDVSCDMSPAFIKGIKENLPNAEITFDKFHIIKKINEAVDQVRKTEAKKTTLLKGLRFAFLRNKENLTQKQKTQLESLSTLNLKSMRALHTRENFQEIYKADTKEDFIVLLKKWYYWATHSKLGPMKTVAKTIKTHWDGVIKWKESQINNGILEGLNAVVQAAKRKARGYKFNHLKTVTYLLTGKLQFFTINPYLPT